MSSIEEHENDWLFDIIINFLKSPAWKAPVMSYIDEHCVVFDSEDENKLEYTPIHKLVDDLLEGLLAELGVPPETFFEACSTASSNPQHKKIYDQIMAVDNFLAFKKLMIRRNTELNNEALSLLNSINTAQTEQLARADTISNTLPQAVGGAPTGAPTAAPTTGPTGVPTEQPLAQPQQQQLVDQRPGEKVLPGEASLDEQLMEQIKIAEEMSRLESQQVDNYRDEEEEMMRRVMEESQRDFERSESLKQESEKKDLINIQTKINDQNLVEFQQPHADVDNSQGVPAQAISQAAGNPSAVAGGMPPLNQPAQLEPIKQNVPASFPVQEPKVEAPVVQQVAQQEVIQNVQYNKAESEPIEKQSSMPQVPVQVRQDPPAQAFVPPSKAQAPVPVAAEPVLADGGGGGQLLKKKTTQREKKVYDLPDLKAKKGPMDQDSLKSQYDDIKRQQTFDPIADSLKLQDNKSKEEDKKGEMSMSEMLRQKSEQLAVTNAANKPAPPPIHSDSIDDRKERLEKLRELRNQQKKEQREKELVQFNEEKSDSTLIDHLRNIDKQVKDKQAAGIVGGPAVNNESPEQDRRKAYLSGIKNDFYKSEEERIKAEQNAKLEAFKEKSGQIEQAKRVKRKEEDAKVKDEAVTEAQRQKTNKAFMQNIKSVNMDEDVIDF